MTTMITKEKGNRQLAFDRQRLYDSIDRVTSINSAEFNEKTVRSLESRSEIKANYITYMLVHTDLETLDEVNSQLTFGSTKNYLQDL